MQFRSLINTIIGIVTIGSVLLVKAQDSTENAVGASTQSSQAVIMGITSSGQAALGIAAIPVLSAGAVAGTVGAGSIAAGKDSAAIATGGSNRDPLPVTDETITVVSPS